MKIKFGNSDSDSFDKFKLTSTSPRPSRSFLRVRARPNFVALRSLALLGIEERCGERAARFEEGEGRELVDRRHVLRDVGADNGKTVILI